MKIGIDFDDVVIDSTPAMHEYHNRVRQTSIEREKIVDYRLEKMWNCSVDEALEFAYNFQQEPEHLSILPIVGAIEGIKELCKKHTLYLITGRPKHIAGPVHNWIKKHIPEVFKEIIFTSHYSTKGGITKADVCRKKGIKIFIDDYPGFVSEMSNSDIKVLILDTPWNKNEKNLPKNFIRVHSWGEILREVEKLEGSNQKS